MYDNITIFYKDAEIIITPFSARRVIKLLKKELQMVKKQLKIIYFWQMHIWPKKIIKKLSNTCLKQRK